MGGKKSWQHAGWQSQDWSSYSSQAGHPSKPWAAPQQNGVQYDQMQLPSDAGARKGKGKAHMVTETAESSDTLRDIQRAVTSARRADGRVRRLKEDRQLKTEQWKLYEQNHKEEYLRQKQRYEAALKKIEVDIQEATRLGQEAAQEVQDIANGRKPAPPPALATDQAWDALMSNGDEHNMEEDFLQDALEAANLAKQRTTPGAGHNLGRLMTPEVAAQLLRATMLNLPPGTDLQDLLPGPERRPSLVTEGPGRTVEQTEPPPVAAPFPPSPSTSHMELGGAPPTGNMTSASPGARPKPGPRVPLKGAPIHPVHTGTGQGCQLADKLEAKRQALKPFGVDHKEPPKSEPPQTQTTVVSGSDDDMAEIKGKRESGPGAGLDGMG